MALLSDAERAAALEAVADAILAQSAELLSANAEDLARMDPQSPLCDRLRLTPERLEGIASDMRHVAALPSPLGRTFVGWHLYDPNKAGTAGYDAEGYATLYLRSGGADSPRQVKLRRKGEQWFLWEQFLLSDIRTPAKDDPWA